MDTRARGGELNTRLDGLRATLAGTFGEVLGSRLGALYAYGSGVDGTFIVGFSDYDVAAFCHAVPSLDDMLTLNRELASLDPAPFAHLQVRFIDLSVAPSATLVPGAYELLWGGIDAEAAYVYGDEGSWRLTTLRAAACCESCARSCLRSAMAR